MHNRQLLIKAKNGVQRRMSELKEDVSIRLQLFVSQWTTVIECLAAHEKSLMVQDLLL